LPRQVTSIDLRLADVWFADATAVARLLRAQRHLALKGRSVVVADVSDDVLHTMRVTGLLAEFTLRDPPTSTLP
jgi:anti-anti-sigma regulatory factor